MENIDLTLWGPLANLIGTWEGSKGDDTAPGDDRGTEKNSFKESFTFTAFGPANNHEQTLYGLSYVRTAWRLGEDLPFHEQLGYLLWDAKTQDLMHSFMIPRGMTVLAGGKATGDAKNFELTANLGSPTFGICSNPFLDREFKTIKYIAKLTIENESTFRYEEDTQIQIRGKEQIFHHIDKNTLNRKV